jgi:anthranilate synthase/aminodeoxychorismate synthase-like glutamine amidotransferase
MIYIIDHKDSFTHNVVHQFSNFGNVECDNFDKINQRKLDQSKVIVFSPGPGSPKDYPMSSKIYKKYKGKKKIIGICLGFQQILYNEKGKIIEQKKIYHGYQSKVRVISNYSLFKKNRIFKVGRYHSLKLKEPFYSKNFEITMRCAISNVAMAIENNKDKIYGFQFHPESFLTENGNLLIKKILSI